MLSVAQNQEGCIQVTVYHLICAFGKGGADHGQFYAGVLKAKMRQRFCDADTFVVILGIVKADPQNSIFPTLTFPDDIRQQGRLLQHLLCRKHQSLPLRRQRDLPAILHKQFCAHLPFQFRNLITQSGL